MKNIEIKFFIDTTVAISAITGRNKDAWILLESGKKRLISLFVNEFVIKEIGRTLKEFDFSQEKINKRTPIINKYLFVFLNDIFSIESIVFKILLLEEHIPTWRLITRISKIYDCTTILCSSLHARINKKMLFRTF